MTPPSPASILNNLPSACGACRGGTVEPFPFTMAFQPILDVEEQSSYAFEALVRGLEGEGAYSILSQVTEENRYAFDQNCRVKAIALASRLGTPAMGVKLSLNFKPGAVCSPAACIKQTLKASRDHILVAHQDRPTPAPPGTGSSVVSGCRSLRRSAGRVAHGSYRLL